MEEETYPCNYLLDLFLVTLHLQNTPNLHQPDLLSIPQTHDLVKRSEQLKRVLQNLSLVRRSTDIRDDASKEVVSIDILEDIGCFVCY